MQLCCECFLYNDLNDSLKDTKQEKSGIFLFLDENWKFGVILNPLSNKSNFY